MDKWDVIEIVYRTIIFAAIVGGSGYFAMIVVGVLAMNDGKWFAYPTAVVVVFAWLMLTISALAWLTLVAKGNFRPVEELEEDMDVEELEEQIRSGKVVDEFGSDEPIEVEHLK